MLFHSLERVLPDIGDIAATNIRVSPLMVAFWLIRRQNNRRTSGVDEQRQRRSGKSPSPILSLRMSWVETVARSQPENSLQRRQYTQTNSRPTPRQS
jgi:hypothetical protein